MISQYIDATNLLDSNGSYVQEIGGWDWVTVQLVTPGATFTFNTTNDPGASVSNSDGGQTSATNWVACQGTNLNTGVAGTTLAATGLMRFAVIGRYLQITAGAAATPAGLFIKLSQIG